MKNFKSQLGVAVLEIIILVGVLAIAGAVYYVNAHSTIKNPAPILVPKKSTTAPPPPPTTQWTRKQFGSAWDLEYPAGWSYSSESADEGGLALTGSYGGKGYKIAMEYPIGAFTSIDDWAGNYLKILTPQKAWSC